MSPPRKVEWLVRAAVFLLALGLGGCGDGAVTRPDTGPDTIQDTASDASSDADAEAPSDVASDVAPDIAGDVTPDVTPDVPPAFVPWPLAADAGFLDFFGHDRVQSIELRVEAAEWQALLDHMDAYASIDSALRSGRYFRATMVHHDPVSGDEVLEEVGFRTRGNTTRVVPQDADGVFHRAHFKLKFDATFDLTPGTPAYATRDERRFRGLKELNLKWNGDEDPSQIRELFAYELMARAGLPVPRTTPVALTITIGGEPIDFGIYLGLEGVDKPFLTRRFGTDDNDGDLYKCLWVNEGPATLEPVTNPRAIGVKDWTRNYRPAYDLTTNEETSAHERLRELITMLDTLDGEALASWLEAHFDVEHFLRFLAMNVLIGMPDDYWAMGNNYYLYFARERAVFIPWDYDHGLGGGWGAEPVWSHEGIATADVFQWKNLNAVWWKAGTRHPLVDEVLAVPRFRARYVELLRAFVDPAAHLFAEAEWAALEAAQATLYAPYLAVRGARDPIEGRLMEDTGVERAYFATKLASVRAQLGME